MRERPRQRDWDRDRNRDSRDWDRGRERESYRDRGRERSRDRHRGLHEDRYRSERHHRDYDGYQERPQREHGSSRKDHRTPEQAKALSSERVSPPSAGVTAMTDDDFPA